MEYILSNHTLTSRSAIQAKLDCPRKRYLNYHYNGIGIVPVTKDIALTTGTEVHYGIAEGVKEFKYKKKFDEEIIDYSSAKAKTEYLATIDRLGGPGLELDSQQQYTKKEQLALIEGLIRCWWLVEFPRLIQRFDIVDTERELLYPLTDNILLQSRCDMLLREKGTKEYYPYSLKTQKGYWYKTERSYKKDLQGVTEILAIEHWFKEQNTSINVALGSLADLEGIGELSKIVGYLERQLFPEKVMGVKFCYLIKGERRDKSKPYEKYTPSLENSNTVVPPANALDANWITNSPLVYGYRKFTPSGIEYAHSDKTIKPENKSGFGKLGKGWEEFRVWESDEVGGVKGWISKIHSGAVQPELGDLIGTQIVITPAEYFRDSEELENRKHQIIGIETVAIKDANDVVNYPHEATVGIQLMLDGLFPQNTQHCHYPVDCSYLPICWLEEQYTGKPVPPNVKDDPIGSGWFMAREPHHDPERMKLVQISEQNKKQGDTSK